MERILHLSDKALSLWVKRFSGCHAWGGVVEASRENRSAGEGWGAAEFRLHCSCVSLSSPQIPSVLVALEVQPHLEVLEVPG